MNLHHVTFILQDIDKKLKSVPLFIQYLQMVWHGHYSKKKSFIIISNVFLKQGFWRRKNRGVFLFTGTTQSDVCENFLRNNTKCQIILMWQPKISLKTTTTVKLALAKLIWFHFSLRIFPIQHNKNVNWFVVLVLNIAFCIWIECVIKTFCRGTIIIV